ncbi:uncharacterized protein MELLADRAFT_71803 [Melampsora larici-populina 98AG31]|uniref:Uncharacterized protein n=1 Tax=Melampsora larici-populina (strain 98AG31 / pathotype 3-4-7) TaxID=747676 RepID=F4RKJ2_MELLP|nr:uncharacterized protein MELLADRAFT_71803 [Melampsora larici-populina 98AG31]EGG07103.1 hypothetical protein MELLADRAFT_71803 [Melampsora larici-populina 98AG31]
MNEESFKDEIYKRIWTIDYGLRIAGIEMINKRKSHKSLNFKRISSIKSQQTNKSISPSKVLNNTTHQFRNYPSILELRESLLGKTQQRRSIESSAESLGGLKTSIGSRKSTRVGRSGRVLEALDGLEFGAIGGFGVTELGSGSKNGELMKSIRLHVSPPYGP